MKKSTFPKTDSIQALAEFWDTHDLTDFEDHLEEVAEPVFARGAAIKVPLETSESARETGDRTTGVGAIYAYPLRAC